MQVKRLFITITVLFSLLLPSLSQARNVSIPDANLAAAIRQEIGNAITTDTLLNLKRLDARNRGIKALTGLEHAQNLEVLELGGEYIEGEGTVNSNTISDFTPLAALTNLKSLYLSNCSISDIAFLAKLTQLTYLNLSSNPVSDVSSLAGLTQLNGLYLYSTSISDVSALSGLTELTGLGISGSAVSDVSPLEGLTQLTYLYLEWNAISDISVLSGLTRLSSLHLAGNEISDVSPLEGLTQLTYLYLGWNAISDISALSGLTQLKVLDLRNNSILDVSALEKLNLTGTEWNSTGLYIERNPLSYAAIYRHIPAMKRKGIEVQFDSRTPTTLAKRLGDAQQAKPRTALATPLVVEVRDEKNIPFAGVPIYFTVTAGGGKVNPAETVSDATGRAETTLTLGSKLVKNTVRVTAPKTQQRVIFSATAVDNPPPTFRKPSTFSVRENTTAVGTVSATDADNQDRVTGYAISPTAGEDSARFSITPKGDLRFKTAPDYERPTTASRSNAYIVLVSATSGTGDRARTGTQPFTITVTDVDEPPDRPAAPTVIPATPTSLIVSWAAPANMGPPMTYEVRYREGDTGRFTNANYNGRETNFTLSDLRRGRQYQVQVRAKNDEGTSDWSRLGIGTPNASPPIDFPDTALRAKVAEALDKRRNAAITALDLLALTELHARNANIRNLTGLEHAHNLRGLDLGGEYIEEEQRNSYNDAISDLSPLQGLTQLTWLDLSGTNVSNVSPLSGLTALTSLRLYNTPLSDVSPLTGLPQLRDLNLSNTPISDVSPLTGLAQLTYLNLSNTPISDVSPLAGLTQLRSLYLHSTSLSDIAALSSLTQLTHLGIGSSDIADLSPLEGLTQLVDLSLWNNAISDISPLKGLTQLTHLHLSSNDISDISSLSGLTQLMVLDLSDNAVLDVSALVGLALPGTRWNSTGLYIKRNPLSYASIHTHIPAMQAKGVAVQFDSRTATTLVKISGTGQQGTINTPLPLPFVVEVRDQHNRAFAGVPVTFNVAAGGGRLSTTSTTTDPNGRAEAHLTLGRTTGTTTVRSTAAHISQPVQFTATVVLLSSPAAIPDPNLRLQILATLGKPRDSTLTMSDMLKLTVLNANSMNIRDLTGLQHATNLTTVSLDDNLLTDAAPLAGLPELKTLSLDNNNLSDIGPFALLTEVETLSLNSNRISNVAVLSALTHLKMLSLNNNTVLDVEPLTRLAKLKTLQLRGNPLSYPSLHTHISAIQSGGTAVTYDPRIPTTLVKVSGTHGVAGESLWLIVEVQDAEGFGFAGVPVSFTVAGGGGSLSPSNVITNVAGRAQTYLTLGTTPGKNIISVAAAEVSHPMRFTITAIKRTSAVTIRDTNLRVKITETLGKPRGIRLTAGDLMALTQLDVRNANIRDLTGLEHAHNLRALNLGSEYIQEQGEVNSNKVSDFSPLFDLTQLTRLDLYFSSLSDVSFLSNLTHLTFLNLSSNAIRDVSPLSGLARLNTLHLGNNVIADVAPLTSLPQLTSLSLQGNVITDVAPLASLTQLTNLDLSYMPLSDVSSLAELAQLRSLSLYSTSLTGISALSGLTQLTHLGITGTSVSDISLLAGLTQLASLQLGNNLISDVSSLVGLTQLTYLHLGGNGISDISALSGLTQLEVLNLSSNAILDMSPLVGLDLPGTRWNSTGLYLERNPLNYASVHTHIPAMQAKGVEVKFDERVPTTLLKISDTAQEGVVSTALPLPFVVEVLDQEDRAFAGVPVKFAVTAGRGELDAKTVRTDAIGRAAAHLTLGRTEGMTTVRATATDISEPVEFTATAILRSSPVMISDANLRMKIMETLGRPLDEAPTASDMLKLTTLMANDANIYDLTGLQHAANLTTLSLNNNYITEGAPLAALTQLRKLSLNNNSLWSLESFTGLTELTVLSLEYNSLSDIKPLTVLPRLKTLHLRGNWLDNSAFDRHIPAMQMKGIDIRFDPRTEDPRPVIRLIYFYPSDREPLPDIDERLDRLIKEAQQFYGDQMEAHGFDRKTFLFETDAQERAVIHHVKGRFSHKDYQDDWQGAWQEAQKRFYGSNAFLLTVLDVDLHGITPCGRGGGDGRTGNGFVTARECANVSTIAHELGHAFGLLHDYTRSGGKWIRSKYSGDRMMTSFCAAEWLNVIPIFNTGAAPINHNTTIKMRPPDLASPPNIMRLSFEVNDPDGIQQVQFFTKERSGWAGLGPGYPDASTELADYKGLNGDPEYTGEFFTAQVKHKNKVVIFRSIDVHGNMTWQEFPVDITSLLPPPKVVLISDPHLASVVREEIRNITTHTILDLTALDVRNHGITDLTGLEHAHNLKRLDLGGEYIDGEGWANSNVVSDFSPLVGLRQLTYLGFSRTGISNISELAGLTQLTELRLSDNNISDISPLEGLTQLTQLYLDQNAISDISALSGLTQLTSVNLSGNEILDVSSLSGLTQLTNLHLGWNAISDISALSGLTQLTSVNLPGNEILDVSPLSGLTQLTNLHLGWNAISDISALSGLTQLTSLNLPGNEILDVSPLSGLTQLTDLYLDGNAISDISALSDLTQLRALNLNRNSILDVSPLIELDLPGTEWESTGLYITENPLSYASIHTHIPAMQAKGVAVAFDFRKSTRLVKISGAGQQGVVNTALPLPFVVEVRDEQNRAFAGVPVTFSVAAGGGKLSVTTVPTDAAGRASAHLTLGRTPGTTTVHVAAAEISRSVAFTATGVLLSAPVTVSDAALHAAIASVLGKSANSNLTASDMLKLTTLTANSANIRELTGLERASNLTTLSLNGNNLSDIAPLAGLSKLTTLSLNNNRISDVAPLAALAELQTLFLENNNLADVTPLSGLTQLKTLALDNNRLWNVSAFIGMSELRTLSLENNDLSDVAPLTSLRRLKTLQLNGNLLSYPSLYTHIPVLQAQGTTVRFDPRIPTTLVNISGTHGVADTVHPISVEVQDAHGFGFSGVPVTFTVTAGGGHLNASNVITDSTGRARTTLTLGPVPGKNTIRAAAAEVLRPVSFSITAVDANSRVTVRDADLRTKIIQTLGKTQGARLTAGDMLGLTRLDARNANVQNLTGLEHAHNLRELNLSGEYVEGKGTVNSNVIADLSPLSSLTQLTTLNLSDMDISDISALSGLTQLERLYLWNNAIGDVSPLKGLTQLTNLHLGGNAISDISALSGLKQLTGLYLWNNTLGDVSPLKELTQLTSLDLGGNTISDISALSGLTQLERLYLWNNTIGDVSALKGLTQLTNLGLNGNVISDISALAGLTQLKFLYLAWNRSISNISALAGLTQLTSLDLRDNAISDVSPLVELNLTGTEWDTTGLRLKGNPLSYASLNTHIPAMQAKGIKVSYDVNLAKITGPWLWMIAPTERWQGGARSINVDSLAAASAGAVTEAGVATNGAKEGDTVGDYAWQLGRIAVVGGDNINDLLNSIGMAQGNIDDHSSYALITLESTTAQSGVLMRVGSDDAIKVWLNGEVVHSYPIDRGASDFQDDFTVDLKKGDNLLLVKVSERGGAWSMFVGIEADVNAVYKRPLDAVLSADVNGDGIVNIQDLVLVASNLGQTGQSRADVNGDGVVNVQDLVMVAGALGQGTAASPSLHASDLEGLTAADIQQMLTQARQLALTDPAYLRGIAVLEQLLALLLPKETALLANYPNPFNPETWIPYQLAKPSEVTLHIYAVNGTLVRVLALGHQSAGRYQSRSRAAYWDGRNSLGETVASGVYFYTLTAGDFTATRKMLIRK